MPGSVSNATPTQTMPWSLCSAFTRSQEFSIEENEYRDGTSQRDKLTETSRKRWVLTKRLTAAALATLKTFYDARVGPHQPFYFYDPWETSPIFDSTPSGSTGRYVVRFDGAWEQAVGIGRADASITLVELA